MAARGRRLLHEHRARAAREPLAEAGVAAPAHLVRGRPWLEPRCGRRLQQHRARSQRRVVAQAPDFDAAVRHAVHLGLWASWFARLSGAGVCAHRPVRLPRRRLFRAASLRPGRRRHLCHRAARGLVCLGLQQRRVFHRASFGRRGQRSAPQERGRRSLPGPGHLRQADERPLRAGDPPRVPSAPRRATGAQDVRRRRRPPHRLRRPQRLPLRRALEDGLRQHPRARRSSQRIRIAPTSPSRSTGSGRGSTTSSLARATVSRGTSLSFLSPSPALSPSPSAARARRFASAG